MPFPYLCLWLYLFLLQSEGISRPHYSNVSVSSYYDRICYNKTNELNGTLTVLHNVWTLQDVKVRSALNPNPHCL
jgi:hypothetical protein